MDAGKLTRRSALMAMLATSAAACGPRAAKEPAYEGRVSFEHGVASGDPGHDRVVIWTRVSPETEGEVPVRWAVARDKGLTRLIASGTAKTSSARDYTVKVDVAGLKAGQTYYYGFLVNEARSPVGRTRTLPRGGASRLRIAAVSCANFPLGFFNVYEAIAKRGDVDVVLHLGDYIYEYGLGAGAESGLDLGRAFEPPVELKSLADYRMRYAQYHRDPDLQAAHAAAPFIVTWDDHEVANDSWVGGAENHQPDEGPWGGRKAAALQAFYEWLPIREPEPGKPLEASHRAFQFGDLATVIMLETRLQARSQQLDYGRDLTWLSTDWDLSRPSAPKPVAPGAPIPRVVKRLPTPYDLRVSPPKPIYDWRIASTADPERPPPDIGFMPDAKAFLDKLADPSRALLGGAQEHWLGQQLALSQRERSTWVIFGSQVVMARVKWPARSKLTQIEKAAMDEQWPGVAHEIALQEQGLPPRLGYWNGYPAQRDRFYRALEDSDANVIVLSGDSHQAWANELMSSDGRTRVADEFGVPSITSTSREDRLPASQDLDYSKLLMRAGGEVKWTETKKRGFTILTLGKKAARAEFFAVSTIKSKDYSVQKLATFDVKPVKGPAVGAIERAA